MKMRERTRKPDGIVQVQYGCDVIAVFSYDDGRKPRIFSLCFQAEFPSLKALMQEWHDYAQFFKNKEAKK